MSNRKKYSVLLLAIISLCFVFPPAKVMAESDGYTKYHSNKNDADTDEDEGYSGVQKTYGGGYSNRITYDHKAPRGPDEITYCENRPAGFGADLFKTSLYVNFAEMPLKVKYTKSFEELSKATNEALINEDLEKKSGREYLEHQRKMHEDFKRTLAYTAHSKSFFLDREVLIKRAGGQDGCVWLTNIHLDVETYLAIFMGQELMAYDCMDEHVREHEDLHVEVFRKMAEKYKPIISEALQEYLDNFKARRVHKSKYSEEGKRISKEITDIIREKLEAMSEETDKLNILIDSKGEYAYGSIACQKGSIEN